MSVTTLQRPRFSPTLAIPEVRVGRTTVAGKGWVTIPFNYTFQATPAVIVTAERRMGSYQPLEFTVPEILLPQIDAITPPAITLPDLGALPVLPTSFKKLVTDAGGIPVFKTQMPTDILAGVDSQHTTLMEQLAANLLLRPMLGFQNFIYTVFMRPIINFLGTAFGGVVDYVVAMLLTEFDEKAYKPLRGKIDELALALGGKVTETRTAIQQGINESLEIMAGGTNEALTQLHSTTQAAVNDLSAQATDALNKSIDMLWDTVGLEEGALMSPISIQNVTSSAFDVWGLGNDLTVHWVAASGVLVENGNGEPPVDPWAWWRKIFPLPTEP